MTVEKPVITPTITTGSNSAMNQSELKEVKCNLLQAAAREKSRVHGGIGFASHWLKNRWEIFNPIDEYSNLHRVITFHRDLKNALISVHATQLVAILYST